MVTNFFGDKPVVAFLVAAMCFVGLADSPTRGRMAVADPPPPRTAPPVMPSPYDLLDTFEDVRLLFTASAYRIHELDTLLRYGRDFGLSELNPQEALIWHQQALDLFEWLKSVDDGGQGLAALTDAQSGRPPGEEQRHLLHALIGDSAERTLRFHQRLDERLAVVRSAVETAAETAGRRPPLARPAMPWAQAEREKGRRMGFTSAWFLWLHHRPDSEHAALDRQQGLDNEVMLHKARKLGVNAILPEFSGRQNHETASWRVVETQPRQFDFSRLDATITRISRYGMRTIVPVRSLDTEPPQWAQEAFGDTTRLARFEATGTAVPTRGVNLFDPATCEAFASYLTALSKHLAENHLGQIAAISLDPSSMALPADIDYSPPARRHFQNWLATRYEDRIERLNARWDSAYEQFAAIDIPPPRQEAPALPVPNNPSAPPLSEGARWRDWIDWRQAWVAEYYQFQIDTIRRQLPDIPLQAYTISANSHQAHSERPVASWPTLAWGRMVDLPSSAATSEPIHALVRAIGGGRFGGQQAEQNFGAMFGGAAYTAFLKDTLFTIARNGPDMILRHFYSDGLYSYMDRQLTWAGAYSYRLKMQEMHRLAPIIENTHAAPGEVAVLWSEHSYTRDPTRFSRYGVLGTAYALMNAKIHYDMLVENELDAETLKRYRVIIVPEQRFLSDSTLAALREYVRAGGRLYATGVPGMFDEYGMPRSDDGLHPLADVFGAEVREFTPVQAVLNTFLVPTRPHAVWDERERGVQWHPREHRFFPEQWTLHRQLAASFTPTGEAQVLYRFADGAPAMVRNRFGNGDAVIFGYPFGHEFAFSNTTEMSFGKLYPHYAYPRQMLNLHRWLGRFLREELDVRQLVQVPTSRMMRFTGTEKSGPTMTYPSLGESFADKRDHTAGPNHSFAIGVRERQGVPSFYVTVFNRDSAYAVGRGYMHYMASPTYGVIRLNRTDVTAIYDVVNAVHVPFVAGDRSHPPDREGTYPEADACISFEAVLPSYFGRVYAIATRDDPVELFAEPPRGDVLDATLVERVATLAEPFALPDGLVLEEEAIRRWLAERRDAETPAPVAISYGDLDYAEAATLLAATLQEYGLEVVATPLELQHRSPNPDPYYPHRRQRFVRPLPRIDVFIGNEHSNSNLADLTAAWQATDHANPRQLVSLNRRFPGGDRYVLQLTSPFYVQRGRGNAFPDTYHRFAPHPRELVVGASSPEGARRGVERVIDLWSRPIP